MGRRSSADGGNGSGKINVHTLDEGSWLRVFADPMTSVPADLPAWLSHAASAWLRQQAHLHVVTAIPVARDGYMVELHVWYAQHGFADWSGRQPKPVELVRAA